MDLKPERGVGEVVAGRFRVESFLGAGGFGRVYLATQLGIDRPVALKLLHPGLQQEEDRVARFMNEAKAVRQLEHPNTVRLYDFGQTEEDGVYIAFQYLEGLPLDEALYRGGAMDEGRVAAIAGQVLRSLMEAHGKGIVHRDIKPPNIFLCDFAGSPDFVKVLDFGLAKSVAGEDIEALTQTGQILGTPAFMAPEQLLGDPVDGRADLYALGLVMAELLAGRPVYRDMSLGQLFLAQASMDRPVALPEEATGSRLGGVIGRATAKAPSARPASAEAMLAEIQRCMREPVPTAVDAPLVADAPVAADAPVQRAGVQEPPPRAEGGEGGKRWRSLLIGGALAAVALLLLALMLVLIGAYLAVSSADLARLDEKLPEAVKEREEKSPTPQRRRRRRRPYPEINASPQEPFAVIYQGETEEFDPLDFFGHARDLARRFYPGANFVKMAADGVGGDGHVDLTRGDRVSYIFMSPSRQHREGDMCHVLVEVQEKYVSVYGVKSDKGCKDSIRTQPSCSMARVIKRARAAGAPRRRARVELNDRTWTVEAGDAVHTFDDDC